MATIWTQVLLILVGLLLGVWGLIRLLESMKLNSAYQEGNRQPAGRWRWVLLMVVGDTLVLFAIVLMVVGPENWQVLFRRHDQANEQEWRDQERIERLKRESLPASIRPNQSATGRIWPGWRGPNRDGIASETGLLQSWPDSGPQVLWRAPIGSGYSSPVVAHGRVYVLDYRKPDERLLCFDAERGTLLGTHSWPVKYQDVDTRWGGDYGPRGTPAIFGEHIYALGADGDLVCCRLEPEQGRVPVVWHKRLFEEFPPQLPSTWWGLSISPLVTDNLVIVIVGSQQGCVLAFDRITAQLKWKALQDKPAYSSPVLVTMPTAPEIQQVIVFTASRVAGLHLNTGEVLWSHPWTTQYDCNIATPIVCGNLVFVSTDYGRGSALLEITRDSTGKWRTDTVYETRKYQNHFATSVLVGDRLYGFHGNQPAQLTCLDFHTGEPIWKAQREVDKGCLLYADGRLIVFTEKGKLLLVEPGEKGYTIRGQFEVFPGSLSTWALPALCDGRLFVRNDRELVCLSLRK